ncbi:MAG: anaerobic ribonucleoside-triphosphate reductase activating protein [Ruminiclostridium sp.]|nr:anaerobic ribonucleoside-triphosphate reductase activating protein [Ruminiclostridium sp.]
MKIKGLQKLTLLDYPEKMACTVFLAGCNFRCPFCHNASLVTNIDDDYISEEEFFSFLNKRKGILNGVCITGGEPTLYPDLEDFIRRIKEMGYLVKLDTNGYNPDILIDLVNKGLIDYVAMDIKNSKEKYAVTAGLPSLDITRIEKSVQFLLSGAVPYEFRTTVVKELHNEEDMKSISHWIENADRYFLQSFQDSGDLIENGYSGYDKDYMQYLLNITKDGLTKANLRGV